MAVGALEKKLSDAARIACVSKQGHSWETSIEDIGEGELGVGLACKRPECGVVLSMVVEVHWNGAKPLDN